MGEFQTNELRSVLLGDKLGEGAAREVFVNRVDPNLVVKIEMGAQSFQNIAEWEFWTWAQGSPMEKWLAPCRLISTCGSVLMMDRVYPLRHAEYPKRLPAFLSDLKPENFGKHPKTGLVVACDYGLGLSAIRTADRTLKKVVW